MVVGDLEESTQVLVVGAGPGGYVAAIRAAQLGKQVTLVDKSKGMLGGVCLHQGCIPSKALIHAADIAYNMRTKNDMGITFKDEIVDVPQLQAWKQHSIDQLTTGINYLLEKNGVEVVQGSVFFDGPHTARVQAEHGLLSYRFDQAIIATGSKPVSMAPLEFLPERKRLLNSDHALEFNSVPDMLVVVGGGYIGMELGTVYAKLGSKVTLVQRSSRILSNMAQEPALEIQKNLQKIGITLLTDTTVSQYQETSEKALLTVETKGKGKQVLTADYVLVALGRKPNTGELGLDKAGVKMDKDGFITINEKCQSNVNHIYAIGDVAGAPLLAHKAFRQGKVAAEVIAGKKSAFDNRSIPAVVFCDPEYASIGWNEVECMDKGIKIKVGKFPFSALGRAVALGKTIGYVKVIAEEESGALLGAEILGEHAGDMIGEYSLALELGATLEDIANTIHPHPTFGEALGEAAEEALGKAIHVWKKK